MVVRRVRFSRAGTLIATAESFVNHAEAGHFVDELDNLLGVGTQDALRKLVADGRLTRHKLAGQFLYCVADRAQQTHQVRARRLLLATPGLGQPLPDADLMPEELRAAIVLFASLLDERQRRLFAGLEALKCGWGGDRRITRLLGIDPSTVAAGRRQLLEHDVEVDRVRRAGGGRTPTEKKRRKSSEIVDIYHAKQHLCDVAKAIYGPGTDLADQWARDRRAELDAGRLRAVVAALRIHVETTPEARRCIHYVFGNRHRMRYPQFRAKGLCISSGVVEAGCKQIGARFKRAGMRWTVAGANAIIALRCCILSGRFDDFWERRATHAA